MIKAKKTFICRDCRYQPTTVIRNNMDIGVSASLELVGKFLPQ